MPRFFSKETADDLFQNLNIITASLICIQLYVDEDSRNLNTAFNLTTHLLYAIVNENSPQVLKRALRLSCFLRLSRAFVRESSHVAEYIDKTVLNPT